MTDKSVLAKYLNIPKLWLSECALNGLPTAKVKRVEEAVKTKLLSLPKATVFVHGSPALVLHAALEAGVEPADIAGVDFAKFFQDVLNSDASPETPLKRLVFVYNVGREPAINTTFAAKLLDGIVGRVSDAGGIVVLSSDKAYTQVSEQYGVKTKNKLNLPDGCAEESIF